MSFMDAVMDGIFTVPGDGFVAFQPLLAQLHAARYDGWLVVEAEQDPRKANPLTYATLGYKNLRQAATSAGLDVIETPARA
jgi:inosose dehydratase